MEDKLPMVLVLVKGPPIAGLLFYLTHAVLLFSNVQWCNFPLIDIRDCNLVARRQVS